MIYDERPEVSMDKNGGNRTKKTPLWLVLLLLLLSIWILHPYRRPHDIKMRLPVQESDVVILTPEATGTVGV